jgi:hypothetical protein
VGEAFGEDGAKGEAWGQAATFGRGEPCRHVDSREEVEMDGVGGLAMG